MTEPTIDEMLVWVDTAQVPLVCEDWKYREAIRAILEQHRAPFGLTSDQKNIAMVTYGDLEQMKLEAIRAFVERVEKRVEQNGSGYEDAYQYATEQELAAMEKEAEQ